MSRQPPSSQKKPPLEKLRALRGMIGRLEGLADDRPRVSSGCAALDGLLEGGFARGTLVEWLGAAPGSGVGLLALLTARASLGEEGALVVVDAPGESDGFYPPAAARLGLDLRRLAIVRPASARDALWAFDQALRGAGVAAALGWFGPLDGRDFRRLQLAAETGDALGMLLRQERFCDTPSWAHTRLLARESRAESRETRAKEPSVSPSPPLLVSPSPCLRSPFSLPRRFWRLEILRRHRASRPGALELSYDDETGLVPLVRRMASSARRRRLRKAQ